MLIFVSSIALTAIATGEMAPRFELPSDLGGTLKLESFKGKKIVLAFFPEAFTPG